METSDSKNDLLSFTLSDPSGISIKPNKSYILQGRLFITDLGNYSFLKFRQTNRFIERWGSSGSDNENSTFPYIVAVDFS